MSPNIITTRSDGVPVTTTLAIAEGVQLKHKNVIAMVREYQHDLEEFGGVAFQTQPFQTQGGTQHREIALLNEQQSTLLMTYMRNSDIVRAFKKRLVKAFWEMAQTKALTPAEQAAEYIANLRQAAKQGAAAQAELDRLLGAPQQLSGPRAKRARQVQQLEPRVRRIASPDKIRSGQIAYVPPTLAVRIENIEDRWVRVDRLDAYLSSPLYSIWHALWDSGLVEWDGWPTDKGLSVGVRLCGVDGSPDVEVRVPEVIRALRARPRTQWNRLTEQDEPQYLR